MAFFGHFWPKNAFFGDGGPETLHYVLQNLAKTRSWAQHPENRVWGPTTDHSGPKNAVLGYKVAFFGHFWAKNAVFFGDGGSEILNNLLQNLAKHAFVTPAPSK